MSLKIGGVDPTKIMVAGTPATRVMLGTGSSAVLAWTAVKRTVTVTAVYPASGLAWGTATGDTSVIQSLTSNELSFSIPMTPSTTVDQSPRGQVTEYGRQDIIRAGETMPAGTTVRARGTSPVTFTEVF